MKRIMFGVVALSLTLAACGPSVSANAVQSAINAVQDEEMLAQIELASIKTQQAWTPIPTHTPFPTYTQPPTQNPAIVELTATPRPTDTPIPTSEPTATPQPTDTPVTTPEPDPISLDGAGDSVVDIEWPDSVGIMHIVGNAGSNYFGVRSYDATGDRAGSLVNTTDVYDGVVIFNTRESEITARLEIVASGNWSIAVLPLSGARVLEVPGVIEGVGDEIIVLTGSVPDLADVVGNAGGRYFGVKLRRSDGSSLGSIVNTTDPYDGTAIMDSDAAIIEVLSSEAWTIEITGR